MANIIEDYIENYYKDDPKKPLLVIEVTPREIYKLFRSAGSDLTVDMYRDLQYLHSGLIKEYFYGGAKLVRVENTNFDPTRKET